MKKGLEYLVKVAGFSFLSLGIGALFAVHLMRPTSNRTPAIGHSSGR